MIQTDLGLVILIQITPKERTLKFSHYRLTNGTVRQIQLNSSYAAMSTKCLAPPETGRFVFPRRSMWSRRNKTHCITVGSVIKCFVIPPNSKLKRKMRTNYLLDACWHNRFTRGFKVHDLGRVVQSPIKLTQG